MAGKYKRLLRADYLLALIAPHGPGWCRLGRISELSKISRPLLHLALSMRTVNIMEPFAAVFIRSTFTVILKRPGAILGVGISLVWYGWCPLEWRSKGKET
jgi:hypothetical protein